MSLMETGDLLKIANGTNDLERLLALSILIQRGALPKLEHVTCDQVKFGRISKR
jgi:hypothetical protein